ncbi:acetylserotonin O-methyltransferase-like isoform X2 [Sceloporus undulatus]|uniref:acetylserotonin O-methyltransferase-like isoform X2 n=1 Tax=Sceloporus undulatus TaxID=8520 RepID=UPI001C4D3629|nr:acetylserotonin O-methyltransferase-like isoform X2 [Sceloporus undulatus]
MDSAEENEMLKLLFQYQHGFIISKIMFTACELGIFDLLLESRDTLSSAAIAARLGTSHMGMKRLLEACVGLKLLKMERKSNEGFYGNTDLGNLCLAKSSPKSQYYYMKFYSEFTYPNFQYLADAVREGKPQVQPAYVTPAKDIFASMYSSDEGVQRFSNAMDSAWSLYGQEMMSAFDLSCFPVVCDLGGDFFKDPVPEADLYILARIFHDWDDNTCMQLLTKVHKACKPGGGLLLLEVALNEDRSGPLEAHIRSIMMLLFTTGRERTLSEYNALLSAGGFKEIQFKKRSFYSAVLGRK